MVDGGGQDRRQNGGKVDQAETLIKINVGPDR